MSTSSEGEYRLPLPTTAQAKSLAVGIEAAISPVITTSLAELATANASGNSAAIASAADAVFGKFTIAGETNAADDDGLTLNFPIPVPASSIGNAHGDRFTIYDAYFALNRLEECASKERAMEALTVALAVVMKDAAKAESEKRGENVYPSVVKNCSKQELMPIITGRVLEGTDIYTGGWKADDGLVLNGYEHHRIHHHQNQFARGKNHRGGGRE